MPSPARNLTPVSSPAVQAPTVQVYGAGISLPYVCLFMTQSRIFSPSAPMKLVAMAPTVPVAAALAVVGHRVLFVDFPPVYYRKTNRPRKGQLWPRTR
jgi:hypothetical protein